MAARLSSPREPPKAVTNPRVVTTPRIVRSPRPAMSPASKPRPVSSQIPTTPTLTRTVTTSSPASPRVTTPRMMRTSSAISTTPRTVYATTTVHTPTTSPHTPRTVTTPRVVTTPRTVTTPRSIATPRTVTTPRTTTTSRTPTTPRAVTTPRTATATTPRPTVTTTPRSILSPRLSNSNYAPKASEPCLIWTPGNAMHNPYKHGAEYPETPKSEDEMSVAELKAALLEARNQVIQAQNEAALLRQVMTTDPQARTFAAALSKENEQSSPSISSILSSIVSVFTPRDSPRTEFGVKSPPVRKRVSFNREIDVEKSLSVRSGLDSVREAPETSRSDHSEPPEPLSLPPPLTSRKSDSFLQQNIFMSISSALRILFAEIGYRHESQQLLDCISTFKKTFPLTKFTQSNFEDRKFRFCSVFLYCKYQILLTTTALQHVPVPHSEFLYNCSSAVCLGGGSGASVFAIAQFLRKYNHLRSVSISTLKVRIFDSENSWRTTWERLYLENFLTCASFEPASNMLNMTEKTVDNLKVDSVDLFLMAFVTYPLFNSSWQATWPIMNTIVNLAKSGSCFTLIGFIDSEETKELNNWLSSKLGLMCIHEFEGAATDFDCTTDNILIHGYQKYVDQFGSLEDQWPHARLRVKTFRKVKVGRVPSRLLLDRAMSSSDSSDSDSENER